jgi:hypothetical protein
MNAKLTEAFKRIIVAKGLVDSGFLLNSIVVTSKIVGLNISLNITGADYLPYVISDNDLINIFQADPLVSEEISNMLDPVLQKLVQDLVDEKIQSIENINPMVTIFINGI